MQLVRIFLRFLALAAVATGVIACTVPEKAEQAQEASIEDGYLQVLADLTKIMQEPNVAPEATLDQLRKYIATSRDNVAGAVKKLNHDVLSLSPEDREVWRRKAQGKLANALDEFARAQGDLLHRMNDAQKWELGEIFRTLQ